MTEADRYIQVVVVRTGRGFGRDDPALALCQLGGHRTLGSGKGGRAQWSTFGPREHERTGVEVDTHGAEARQYIVAEQTVRLPLSSLSRLRVRRKGLGGQRETID